VVEKPVQKFTTAGAESVPPAPWVKISGCASELGRYELHCTGFLMRSELMDNLSNSGIDDASAGLLELDLVDEIGFDDVDGFAFVSCLAVAFPFWDL
jgi:hypothetical protein